ncbi:ArsR family transcriptional regulator [Aliarcobacter butzleri]|uniref:ArsR family transcriptional regulator n=1 Tax=Aliarcobacter butzleri TaxID=28197 RepID=UPI0021B1E628|nr:ArsR family transcriptional regulator [Aliarcobacter butzleri]MCT7611474.1 ArsR family transcriptional regulator [Aliarcobacter butzleri]
MLEVLFGSKNAERVLQFLLARNNAYAREIALFYDVSPSVIKNQLEKFEIGNIIVGRDIGNIRVYELNQRNPFINELTALLLKARTTYEPEDRARLVRKDRTRPRSKNKPLIQRRDNIQDMQK